MLALAVWEEIAALAAFLLQRTCLPLLGSHELVLASIGQAGIA